MQWFTYHNVLRLIALCIVIGIVLIAVGAGVDSWKPGNWLTRLLWWLLNVISTLAFLVDVVVLVAVIVFWLIYPMTPDYRDHERHQGDRCLPVGFVNDNRTAWVIPDRC